MNSLAFVFPGQGSQSVGMLSDFIEVYPKAKVLLEQASSIFSLDYQKLLLEGPIEALNLTTNTQPAVLIADTIIWEYWCEHSKKRPSIIAGHSLGEYSALVAADVLSFEEALNLVHKRAQFMQEAVPKGVGAMAAIIGLSANEVEAICAEAASETKEVMAANLNSPGQIVISGYAEGVAKAMEFAKAKGAKLAKMLPVSVPSHSTLMHSAAEKFKPILDNAVFNVPSIDVINNVDVAIEKDPAKIKEALLKQLYSPVRWIETIEKMASMGVKDIHECGPGKVLTGMNKRIDRSLVNTPIGSIESIDNLD
jgi:[acyl-carrier-protein] S-malonyltransferase